MFGEQTQRQDDCIILLWDKGGQTMYLGAMEGYKNKSVLEAEVYNEK